MAYIGSTPTSQSFTPGTDYFSGNGSTVAFTLTRPAVSINDLIVVIENVVQKPLDAYTVVGTTLTFTSAPPSGTNNIYVRYMSVSVSSIMPNDLSVTTNKIADGVVTLGKLHTAVMQPANISDKANTSTGYLDLPAGTTAQRPASPDAGATRFNTTTGLAEYWSGSQWASFGSLSTQSVNYLIVAGGGGGGGAGGGGGGGVLTGISAVSSVSSYTITIGSGGAGATAGNGVVGVSGANTTALGLTAIGGGGGGSYRSGSSTNQNGLSGGSGGGGGWWSGGATTGGSGTSGQGNAGGSNSSSNANPYCSGGGGGAGAVGGNNSGNNIAGNGGIGLLSAINGTSYYWGGGGGGGAQGSSAYAGAGGNGGGGGGAMWAGTNFGAGGAGLNAGGAGQADPGTTGNLQGGSGGANTGGGGGGMGISVHTGGAGGSGIVIISYPAGYKDATISGTVVKTTYGGNTIYTFTGSGTIAF